MNSLFSPNAINPLIVEHDGMRAMFHKTTETGYEVILEINSNKFSLFVDCLENEVLSFEIFAMKGFVELSLHFVQTLRHIIKFFVGQLYKQNFI